MSQPALNLYSRTNSIMGNFHTLDDVTKNSLEEERVQLLKIIENLSLLKRQMDFLGYRDYSNLIIRQINQIKNILNDC